ncbi:MAG: AbrB/MazE/SpoVT family DNA-binding domain-containing protein [Chloroflexota bacterium]
MDSYDVEKVQPAQVMQTYSRKVSYKGVVTIPVEVRRALDVKPNEMVTFCITDEKVEVTSGPMSLEDAMGSVRPLPSHLSTMDVKLKMTKPNNQHPVSQKILD